MQPITLTDNAKKYLSNACDSENKNAIKLEVKGGGCAGFSYNYDFVESEEDNDFIYFLDNGKKFIVDSTSMLYVFGTVVDYENRLGSSSLVIKNPNETSSCGCGKSFSV